MQPQAMACQGPGEQAEAGRSLPTSGGSTSLQHLDFRLPASEQGDNKPLLLEFPCRVVCYSIHSTLFPEEEAQEGCP
jgi:hypothetical protein